MESVQTRSREGRNAARRRGWGALLLLVLAAAMFFVAGLMLFVRTGLDGDTLLRTALPHLEKAIGRKVSFTSARLTWRGVFTPRLRVSGLAIHQAQSERVRLHVASATIDIRPWGILHGTLIADNIQVVDPVLNLYPSGPRTAAKRQESSSIPCLLGLYVERLHVTGGKLVVFPPGNGRGGSVLLKDIRLTAAAVTANSARRFVLDAVLPGTASAGRVKLSGRLKSSPLGDGFWQGKARAMLSGCPAGALRGLASAFRMDIPLSAGTFGVVLDLDGRTGNFTIAGRAALRKGRLEGDGVFLRTVAVSRAEVAFTAAVKKDTLFLDISRATLPGLELSASTRIGRLSSGDASAAISIRIAEINLEKLFPLLPVSLLSRSDRVRLKQAGLRGRVAVKGAAWNGRLTDLLHWRLAGSLAVNALLENVSGFIPGFGLPVKNASGRVRINADEVLLNRISLTLGMSPIVLNGAVTDLRSSTPLVDLFLSMKARAADIEPILRSRIVASRLPRFIGRVKDPQGKIAVSLDIKGSLHGPRVMGVAALDRFGCMLEGIPFRLKDMAGSFRFEGSLVTFKEITGMVGGSRVKIGGSLSPRRIDLSATASLNAADLRKLGLAPSLLKIGGRAPVSLILRGRPSQITYNLKVGLKGNRVESGWLLRKKAGTPLVLDASGSVTRSGLEIRRGFITVGSQKISLSGSLEFGKQARLTLRLPPKGIRTENLMGLTGPGMGLRPGGRIEGQALLAIGPRGIRDLSVTADVLASHVTLQVPGFPKPLRGLTARIRWRGPSFLVDLNRLMVGDSRFTGRCRIVGWREPHIDLQLSAPFLDSTDFFAPQGHGHKQTWPEWIASNWLIRFLARSRGRGRLTVRKGTTSRRAFSDFKAEVIAGNGLMRVPNWSADFGDGKLMGNAVFDLRPGAKTLLRTEFQGDNLKMHRVLLTDPDSVSVESDFLLDGYLAWHPSKRRENNGIYKTGRMEVRLRDGVIHKFDVLSKIFSLINLGSLLSGRLPDIMASGLSFNRLTWEMDVFDSKWRVRNLKLLSDAATIDAEGMYFSDQNRVDFKVDVSPLVGFDKIISGLFGDLIVKDGKILTTTFRVRGLTHSPDVRLEPLQSLRSE